VKQNWFAAEFEKLFRQFAFDSGSFSSRYD
jgi:hypothetical protein